MENNNNNNDSVPLNVIINSNLKKRFKKYCIDHDLSLQEGTVKAINNLIKCLRGDSIGKLRGDSIGKLRGDSIGK